MHSPTSSEDSRLVKIVVLCAQTRLPGRGDRRDALSSSSERCKRRAFRQACSAGQQASSKVRGDVCSLSWSGGRFDIRVKWECCHCTVTVSLCSEGCGLRHNMLLSSAHSHCINWYSIVHSML